jgi:hypothetical protein
MEDANNGGRGKSNHPWLVQQETLAERAFVLHVSALLAIRLRENVPLKVA